MIRQLDGLTVTVPRNYGDCWAVAISEWLGVDYDYVYQVAKEAGLISEGGYSRTEKVLRALGLEPETVIDDGGDGIIRVVGYPHSHVMVRCCGQLLNTSPEVDAEILRVPVSYRIKV